MGELKRFYINGAKQRIYDKDAGLCDAHEADALIAKLDAELKEAKELLRVSAYSVNQNTLTQIDDFLKG